MGMANRRILIIIIFNYLLTFISSLPEEPELTYYKLYEVGRIAYKEERWYECAAFMRRALEDYKFYQGILWNCHQRCDRHIKTDPFPIDNLSFRQEKRAIFDNNGVLEARILEKFVKKALCLRRCKSDRFPGRPDDISDSTVEREFREVKPYSYMQFCYWKLGDLEHAISAAYTYLIRNPSDTMMSENLKYYTNEKLYNEGMLKDLEQKEYQGSYLDGTIAYDEKRYMDVIDKMERSLESFFEEYAKCRALCDVPAVGDLSLEEDFYSSVTTFYMQVLKCRSDCERSLTIIKGNRMDDFLASHFHYLQFAYWKESMVRKAADAVATFLLFYPEDETMLHNKRYYLDNFSLKLEQFVPRLEVVQYYKRTLLEKRLLAFLEDKFNFEDDEYSKYNADDYRDLSDDIPGLDDEEYIGLEERGELNQETIEKEDTEEDDEDEYSLPPAPAFTRKGKGDNGISIPHMEVTSPFWTPSAEVLNKYAIKHGVKVVKRENDLSGRYRFLADHLLSEDECHALMELSKLADLGDGYRGEASPHTKHEEFRGLNITRVAELALEGKVPLESAKLLLDKSETGRDLVQTYFNLTTHLYFDYTHFVCRSAKKTTNEKGDTPTLLRSDLSHAIHGDNCLFSNGRCDKRFPAYTWRDYSAVIYLNDDFAGGEFIFSDKNKDIQAEIKPKCGQMVAFSGDTLHGVKGITHGSRCVIALWLTLDPSHEELERIQTQQTLAKIEMAKDDVVQKLVQEPVSQSGEL